MKQLFAFIIAAMMMTNINAQENIIYQSPAYTIYNNRVVQGEYEATALSSTKLQSNYESPANKFQPGDITFKFAINGRDNEMPSGTDHHYAVLIENGKAVTPVIVFGKQLKEENKGNYLDPNTPLTIRVDMREVLKQFEEFGHYTTFNGDKIYKEDFKGVYVAGGTAPMTWDFDNLANNPQLKLKDPDGNGIYETTLMLNTKSSLKETAHSWELSKDISAFPMYSSDYMITDALYNMAIEEMTKAVETDNTFRTGQEWAGVWTRDVSYSIILSMAYLQPQVAKNSLLRKVSKDKRIIQDTGTGGAWPVSTDRMIWAVAAFDLYKATGDKDWLQQAYEIIKNSIEDDLKNIYDHQTGLVKGESSFLDWREQTYPKWMQPADIYESECLGTNAVHYQANIVLSQMANMMNHPAVSAKHKLVADNIKNGINKYLWVEDKGYYGQFLYGRNYKMLSPRAEALGEALSVLWDIADEGRQNIIVRSVPIVDFGIPCIYPQIPGIPPYHNNGVWPFVQSYWLLAGAKTGNDKSVLESIAAIYRPAALFLTNKENFVADNGDFRGTQINSSNMLWSLAGNISIVHKVIFGLHVDVDNLTFSPFVPKELAGKRTLKNFTYRKAMLNISMEGYGNGISAFYLDGKKLDKAVIPATLSGQHDIRIVLNNKLPVNSEVNKVVNKFSPPAPHIGYNMGRLSWLPAEGAVKYQAYLNGELMKTTTDTIVSTDRSQGAYASFQVIALDENNVASFASEPLEVIPEDHEKRYEAERITQKSAHDYKGFTGDGFVEISHSQNDKLTFGINVKEEGWYAIDYRYANGNGPTNTENKCAIRNLTVDTKDAGTIVLPQRGKGEWSNWGYSNAVQVLLKPGMHSITLSFEPYNENMNGEINQAMIDYMRVVKME